MPDRRKLHEGAQMATNTKHRERRSMAEAPASAGDNGADAAPATPYNHSPAQPYHFLTCIRTSTFTTTYLGKNYNARTIIMCVVPVYTLSINVIINRLFVASRS